MIRIKHYHNMVPSTEAAAAGPASHPEQTVNHLLNLRIHMLYHTSYCRYQLHNYTQCWVLIDFYFLILGQC